MVPLAELSSGVLLTSVEPPRPAMKPAPVSVPPPLISIVDPACTDTLTPANWITGLNAVTGAPS